MKKFETLTIVGGKGSSPHDMKIYLGGKEITNSLTGIEFRAFVGEAINVKLHLYVKVDEIEIIHLQSADLSDKVREILGDE